MKQELVKAIGEMPSKIRSACRPSSISTRTRQPARFQLRTVSSIRSALAHFSASEADRFRRCAFAESAIVTRAAPIMMASLMTSRPAPLRYGKPC